MTSRLFRHALQPRILLRSLLVLLLILSHQHETDALRRTRCKTSEDCAEPENAQFCDENFFACMPCDDYCTGAEDTIPICREKCPIRYTTVYGRDKQPEVPKADVPQADPEPPKEPAPVSQNTKEDSELNIEAIVVGCFLAVAAVAVVAVVILYRRYPRKPDSPNGQEHDNRDEEKATDKLMDGGNIEDEEKVKDEEETKVEDEQDKEKEKPGDNEIENEVAKTEQADFQQPPTDVLVISSSADINATGQPKPNPNIDIDYFKGIKDQQTTPVKKPLQSMGLDETPFNQQVHS